jgi:hypothetical protein
MRKDDQGNYTIIDKWSIQYFILPLTGWFSRFLYLNKKPRFLYLRKQINEINLKTYEHPNEQDCLNALKSQLGKIYGIDLYNDLESENEIGYESKDKNENNNIN